MTTDTREQLLIEAEKLIRTRGYSGFSYADLAARVKISKASIHHHFAIKAVLAAASIKRYQQRHFDIWGQLDRSIDSGIDRIIAYGRAYEEEAVAGQGCLCGNLAMELATLDDELKALVARFFERQHQWLTVTAAYAIGRGELADGLDAQEAAYLAQSCIQGAVVVSRSQGKFAFDQALATLRSVLLSTTARMTRFPALDG